jgi:hypothetical protein
MDFDFNYIQSEDFNIDMIEQNLSEKDKGIKMLAVTVILRHSVVRNWLQPTFKKKQKL